MRYLFIIFTFLFAPFEATATDWAENPKIDAVFSQAQTIGTFVVYDIRSDRLVGCNQARAKTRFSPASTFKIPHSLIGLSVGAVKSVDDIIPYHGPEKPFIKEWKRDMGLRDAIVLSNVPIYRELARRIGLKRMQDSLKRMRYGNMETGLIIDEFWLHGPLKISAIEQVKFLAKLAQNNLDFPTSHQGSVREITLVERGSNWELHAKTGWENAPGPGVGWWVGWVKKNGDIFSFAINIEIVNEADAVKRTALGRTCLEVLGILPAEGKTI